MLGDRAFVLSVRGRVQGVGFRHFVSRLARRLGIKGWVRNERDGSVRIAAAGPPQNLDEFVSRVREGPPSAWVESVQMEPHDDSDYALPDPFVISY